MSNVRRKQTPIGFTSPSVGAERSALAGHDAIEDQSAEQNGEPSKNALSSGGILERLQDIFTEAFGADQ